MKDFEKNSKKWLMKKSSYQYSKPVGSERERKLSIFCLKRAYVPNGKVCTLEWLVRSIDWDWNTRIHTRFAIRSWLGISRMRVSDRLRQRAGKGASFLRWWKLSTPLGFSLQPRQKLAEMRRRFHSLTIGATTILGFGVALLQLWLSLLNGHSDQLFCNLNFYKLAWKPDIKISNGFACLKFILLNSNLISIMHYR